MSAIDGVDQDRPVTTTYDASNDAQPAAELHAFITERALERVAAAGAANDWVAVNAHLRGLHVVDAVYAATKRSPEQEAAAVEHLRIMTLRDRHHAAYRPAWAKPRRRRHARSRGSSG